MDLNEIIEISNGNYNQESVKQRKVSPRQMQTFSGNMMIMDSNVDNLNEMVFGKPTSDSLQIYDAKEDMKRMTQNLDSSILSKSKLPDMIKESIAKNPLNLSPVEDPKMDALTERLTKAMPGIQKSMGILNQLDNADKQKQKTINETTQSTKTNGGVDYEMIKMIVENAVEKKFNEYRGVINESVNSNATGNLYVMKLGEKFLFLDDQDNVYECQMTYKGKNKKKKKK